MLCDPPPVKGDPCQYDNIADSIAKANVLIKFLPYIRDFNNMVILVELREAMGNIEGFIKDLMLLKGIGMKPVLICVSGNTVLVEKCMNLLYDKHSNAIHIHKNDPTALRIMLDKGYICVIQTSEAELDNFIKNMAQNISIGKLVTAYKKMIPVFLQKHILTAEGIMHLKRRACAEREKKFFGRILQYMKWNIGRVHILPSYQEHALLLELFSIEGIGTAVIQDKGWLYTHEGAERERPAH